MSVSEQQMVLSFNAEKYTNLRSRSDHPVVGVPIGTLPSNPQQNSQLGAPFAYTSDQQRIADGRIEEDRVVGAQEAVLLDLTQRGYFVTNGVRHGFDFVVYEGDPIRHHGSYFVIVADQDLEMSPRELVLWHRLAASAHKAIIIAVVQDVIHEGKTVSRPEYHVLSGEER